MTMRGCNGTTLNKPSQNRTEETNSPSNQQRLDSKNHFQGRTTHYTDDLWTFVSIITFIADIGSDLLVCIKYYKDKNLWWFGLTLGFLLAASFAMQLFSAKWLLEDSKRQHCFTYILHVLHLGPVQRQVRLVIAITSHVPCHFIVEGRTVDVLFCYLISFGRKPITASPARAS